VRSFAKFVFLPTVNIDEKPIYVKLLCWLDIPVMLCHLYRSYCAT